MDDFPVVVPIDRTLSDKLPKFEDVKFDPNEYKHLGISEIQTSVDDRHKPWRIAVRQAIEFCSKQKQQKLDVYGTGPDVADFLHSLEEELKTNGFECDLRCTTYEIGEYTLEIVICKPKEISIYYGTSIDLDEIY